MRTAGVDAKLTVPTGLYLRQDFIPSPVGGPINTLVSATLPAEFDALGARSTPSISSGPQTRSNAVTVALPQVNLRCQLVNTCERVASKSTCCVAVIYSLAESRCWDLGEEDSMSFVTTQPEALAAAAANLQGIGTTMNAQNAAAAAPTTGVVPAAADEVSALTAAQFAAHAQMYQTVSAQAAAIHEMFVNTLVASSGSYAATEAANAAAAG